MLLSVQHGPTEAPFTLRGSGAAVHGDRAFEAAFLGVDRSDRDALHDAASRMVSTAFVAPILESLNQSPLRPTQGPFALGAAEKRFLPLLHQELADRITTSANFGLIESIVNRYQPKTEGVSHGRA